jgi:hypothetical protein
MGGDRERVMDKAFCVGFALFVKDSIFKEILRRCSCITYITLQVYELI